MRKFLVVLLCLMLVVTACGTKEKIPEGMSKEFYHAMLEMNKEIQKSLETKEFTLDLDNEKYRSVFKNYILPAIKDELLPEDYIKELIENGYNLDSNMTEKEKVTAKSLFIVITDLETYFERIGENEEAFLIESSKNDFEENYKKFRLLLELQ